MRKVKEEEEEGVRRRSRANADALGRFRGGSRCPVLAGTGLRLRVASKGSLGRGALAGGALCSLLGPDAPGTRSDEERVLGLAQELRCRCGGWSPAGTSQGPAGFRGASRGRVRPPVRPQPLPVNALDDTLNPPFL